MRSLRRSARSENTPPSNRKAIQKLMALALFAALLAGLVLPALRLMGLPDAGAQSNPAGDVVRDRTGAQLIWLWREDEATLERVFDKMVAGGIKWLRTDFFWSNLEPAQGTWTFDQQDLMVSKAKAHGINILGILATVPNWANGKSGIGAEAYPPTDYNTWNTYVRTLCQRYGADVSAWEIWNEQNIASFAVDAGKDKEAEYMNLVRRASQEIRAYDADATIVLGGVAGYDPAFIEECLKKYNGPGDEDVNAGAVDYVDAVAFHPYPFVTMGVWTNNPHPHESEMRTKLVQLRNILTNPAYTSGKQLEMWITEVGWTNSKDYFNYAEASTVGVDESTQAAYALRSFINYMDDYLTGTPGDCTVARVFYYNLRGQLDREEAVYKTGDGGLNWTYQSSGDYRQDGTSGPLAISALDALNCWAVGDANPVNFALYNATSTADGGTNWVLPISSTLALKGVSLVSQNSGIVTVFAVGEGGVIVKYTGSSAPWPTASWTQVASPTKQNLNGIFALNPNVMWAVGNKGTILKTTDAGATWVSKTSGTTEGLIGVTASDASNVWAVGLNGTVLKSTNGGESWTRTTPTTNHLTSVTASNASVLWAAGFNGTLLKSVNGGASWTAQTSGTTSNINGISAASTTTAWAVGQEGTVLKTSNGGANWAEQTNNYNPPEAFRPPGWVLEDDKLSYLAGVEAVDANTVFVVGFRPTDAPVPMSDGNYCSYVKGTEKYGLLQSTFVEKPAFKYVSRLGDANVFGNSVAIASGYLFSSTSAPATLEKHLFRMADGSVLLALWNSYNVNANSFDPANDPDAVMSFTFKNPSGSSANTTFDNPVKVNLLTGGISAVSNVTRDASGNINLSSFTVGKDPVVLKFAARAGAALAAYSVKPVQGAAGTEVTVDGRGFGATRGTSTVKFGSTAATEYTYWSDTRVKCKVPAAASAGAVQLTVVTGSGTSNQVPFTVLSSGVSVTSITPNSGTQNTTVNVTNLAGSGFPDNPVVWLEQGTTKIDATSESKVSSTQITCTFTLGTQPTGAYDVVVSNPAGTQQGRLTGGFTVNAAGGCGTGAVTALPLFGLMMGLMALAGVRSRERSKELDL